MSQRSLSTAVDWTGKGSEIMGKKRHMPNIFDMLAGFFVGWLWNTSANLGTKAVENLKLILNNIDHLLLPFKLFSTDPLSWLVPYYKWAISEVSKYLPMHKSSHWVSMQYSRLLFVNCQGYCRSPWVPGWRFPKTHLEKAAKCWGKCMWTVAESFLLQRFLPQRLEVEGTWENKSEKGNEGTRDKLTLAQGFYILILL